MFGVSAYLSSRHIEIIATVIGWAASVMLAYAAIKSDIAVLKSQRVDDRAYMTEQTVNMRQDIQRLNEKMDALLIDRGIPVNKDGHNGNR